MRPDPRFTNQSADFWSCVKIISQRIGYSKRGQVIVPSQSDVKDVFHDLKLSTAKIFAGQKLTTFGETLFEYFNFRSQLLHGEVEHNLMDVQDAAALFHKLREKHNSKCPLPMNKQKGDKKTIAFFTASINILVEASVGKIKTIFDPRQITAFTKNKFPARSLSRRVDGSFPDEINPIAIWEIKEYYYTTTFGSRIADGVYETMLDGYELNDARLIIGRPVFHYLMIDSRRTWWEKGIPYLCRIVDMLNMGLITECIVGREIEARIPVIVQDWLALYKTHRGDFADDQLTVTVS